MKNLNKRFFWTSCGLLRDMLVGKGSRASSQGQGVIGAGKGTIRLGQDL